MNLFMNYQKTCLWVFLIFMSAMLSCSKDIATDPANSGQENGVVSSSLQTAEGTRISLSYDMTMSKFTRASNAQEQKELTPSEQSLSYPKFAHCHVEAQIGEDGMLTATIQMLPLADAPKYPVGTMGHQVYPEEYLIDRIEISNGNATHYNKKGEVIANERTDASTVSYYQNIIQNMVEHRPFSREEMSWVIEGFKEAGYDMETVDDKYEILTQPFTDGSSSRVVLNKELGVLAGQANYDASGKVTTKSNFYYEGESGNPVLRGHRFVTYVNSPFTNKRMAITEMAKIENFSMTLN